ncbi:thioesterase II family protein [Kitasatospora sp. NPDC092286]|uniref:thioesterase II family protein n=1 Tax=Kitasatospora sp. NPDC092286 TaxID=3364087 RepID=UPI0038030423
MRRPDPAGPDSPTGRARSGPDAVDPGAAGPAAELLRVRRPAAPELRLFVLHHAGGSHVGYRPWAPLLPPEWEVCLVEAPGRIGRSGPPCRTADELAGALLRGLSGELDRPYALFGHSMGAIAAYELTHALHRRGLPLPEWLGLSGLAAPEHHPRRVSGFDLSDDDQLRSAVEAMGGTPRAILDDPEFWPLLTPVLRADFGLVECWRPDLDREPLPVPLAVYGGERDEVTPPGLLPGWAARTTRFLGTRLLPGAHFYFQPAPTPLLRLVVEDVRAAR